MEPKLLSVELDPVFRQALKQLHSPSTDSAETIRKYLDELTRQRHGSSKMLVHTLHKKHLAEECRATGSGGYQPKVRRRRSSEKSCESSGSNASSAQATSLTSTSKAATILLGSTFGGHTRLSEPRPTPSMSSADDNAIDNNMHSSLFDDLMCVTCRGIDVSAKNRLIECTKCNALYHQECHTPHIKDGDLMNGQEVSWHCNECTILKKSKSLFHSMSSPAKSNQSPHSSSSSSSSSSTSNHVSSGSSAVRKEKDKAKDGERESTSSSGKSLVLRFGHPFFLPKFC